MESYKYSPSKKASKTDFVTYWDLYKRAAMAKYGEDIIISESKFYKDQVNKIDFDFTLVSKEEKPREATRTINDINMKEFKNRSKEAQDETVVKTNKSSSTTNEERYKFSTTKGVDLSVGANIGAQVMGLSIAGGSLGVSTGLTKKKSETKETETSNTSATNFSYEQEETMMVPARTHVKAIITTYSMKYEMNYNLRFSIKRNSFVPLSYKTRCQQCFCGIFACSTYGTVLVRDMISGLLDYKEDDEEDTASFIQGGTLSWVGEGCSVEKEEEPLGD